jgi:hypothetical protein
MEENIMAVKFFRIVSYVLMVVGGLAILGAVGAPDEPQYAPSLTQVAMLLVAGFTLSSFGWRMYVATEPRRIFLRDH